MVFLKLFLLVLSSIGIGYATNELCEHSRYKLIYDKGVEFLKNQDYKSAEKAFKKVFEINPLMENNLYNLGLTYFFLGKLDLSLSFFEKTLAVLPEDVDTYYNIGIINYLKNRKKETIEIFEKAFEFSEKKDQQILFNMAIVYSELQDYDLAIKSMSRLIELEPSNIEFRMALAEIYEKLIAETGNLQSVDFAIKTYQEVLDIDERHEGANIKIASCYAQKGDIVNCKEYCERVLKKNSKSTEALNLLGIISFSLQEFQNAINYFTRIITENANFKMAYLHIAYAYAKLERKEEAIVAFNQYKEKANPKEVTDDVNKFFKELIAEDEEEMIDDAVESEDEEVTEDSEANEVEEDAVVEETVS